MNKNIRKQVYWKYGGHCAYCGKTIAFEDMQVDHLIPLRRGDSDEFLERHHLVRGTDDMDNLMPSCRSCNFRKGEMTLDDFRKELVLQRDRIVMGSFQVRQSLDYGLLLWGITKIRFFFERTKQITQE
jgi:5-methylcytosine-specific restriction endonuclease McrA